MWTCAYVASVVLVNVIFGHLPYPWSVIVGSTIVGGIFILRDYAQREIGHRVLLATAAGIVLSYLMASPAVAVASAAAFAAAELADWAVFSFVRRPFRQRVLISSAVSVPLDTVVFLAAIGALGFGAVALQMASKFLALLVLTKKEAA